MILFPIKVGLQAKLKLYAKNAIITKHFSLHCKYDRLIKVKRYFINVQTKIVNFNGTNNYFIQYIYPILFLDLGKFTKFTF